MSAALLCDLECSRKAARTVAALLNLDNAAEGTSMRPSGSTASRPKSRAPTRGDGRSIEVPRDHEAFDEMHAGMGEGNVLRYGELKDDLLVYGIPMLPGSSAGSQAPISMAVNARRPNASRVRAITASYDL
jgi:hypothetical protein